MSDGMDSAEAGRQQQSTEPHANSAEKQLKTKRKRSSKPTTISQFTIRKPFWAYIHLALLVPRSQTSQPTPPVDAITAHLHLQSALGQFLGLHGTAIPFDILKLGDQDVWIRVPKPDVNAVVAAVGGWIGKGGHGWRVKVWNCWGPKATGSGGKDLFGED